MNNTIKQRYKNAIRFFEQEGSNTWLALSQTDPWDDEAHPPVSDPLLPSTCVLLSGTISAGDVVSLTFTAATGLPGSPITVNHTVLLGDTLATIVSDLISKINGQSVLMAANVTADDGASFPNGLLIQWPNSLVLSVTANVTGLATEVVTFTDLNFPVIAVLSSVFLVYENPPTGPFQVIDVNGNTRYFSAFPDVPTALAGRCLKVLMQGLVNGSDFDTVASSFRQVGFLTDLVRKVGVSSSVVFANQIADWGQLEAFENRLADGLQSTSKFRYTYIMQY